MNEQKPPNSIEWTRINGRRGFTWNPLTGCAHACRWNMSDGKIAECYAKAITEKFGRGSFEQIVFHSNRLNEPLKMKDPSGIFVCSMSDLFAHYVPAEQIEAVLDVCRRAHWHTFQFLTKNPVRIKEFTIPDNCWMGASSPPDYIWGKPLSRAQQERMLRTTLNALAEVNVPVRWMSIEPLSWDIVEVLEHHGQPPMSWVVAGAASNGSTYYQPDPQHLRRLITFLDTAGTPIFYKGNLRPSIPDAQWREEFPTVGQQELAP